MTIPAAPTTPDRGDSETFPDRADAFVEWMANDLVPAFNADIAAMNLNDTTDTSASSVVIGTGSKSFTVSASKSFVGGMWLSIADDAAPSTNSMVAQVTSYNIGTGALVVNVPANGVFGSGTKTAWTISLTSAPSTTTSAAMAPVVAAATLAAARSMLGAASNTNIIDNGNFNINQRAVSGTVTLAAGAFGHDRWKAGASGCTYTFSTSANITTLTISAGSLVQNIRGETLQTGTNVLSWSGTAQGKIGAGSYAVSGVTGSATGGTNLAVEFGTGTLSLVQFVPGTTVIPFIHRHKSEEESLCQKSFVRLNYAATYDLWVAGYCVINEYLQSNLVLPVPMWGTPTATTSAALTTTNVYQTFVAATSTQTVYVRCRATATGQASCYNTGAFYIDLTSEI